MGTSSMEKSINLIFKKRPSIMVTALFALLGKSSKFNTEEPFPQITAQQNEVTINRNQLVEFNSICGIAKSDKLPVIYPFALIYPLLQRILARREAPLSLFVVLNSRMQTLQHRAIGIDEKLDIYCSIAGHRIREKGLEMDIASIIKSDGIPVWENTQTFYYRGKFGKPEESYQPPQFEPIPGAEIVSQWFLPSGIGQRFSRVSGDGNPLHYRKYYARMFGFKRDFAQPLLILGTAITHLLPSENDKTVSLDIALKAPIYYESNMVLKSAMINGIRRFDIYMEGNDLPCICGKLKTFSKEGMVNNTNK
jgi:hypothetical protein